MRSVARVRSRVEVVVGVMRLLLPWLWSVVVVALGVGGELEEHLLQAGHRLRGAR